MSETKTLYEIDGEDFSTLEGFYDVVSRKLIPGAKWGRNLNAFNDILRGGFGTPDGGFILRWKNAGVSRQRLAYDETIRQLQHSLIRCHPDNRDSMSRDLERAQRGAGPTVFDWLVDIISIHCAGGEEEEDGIELILD